MHLTSYVPTYLPTWGVPCGCVYLGATFSCAPPFLAGVLGWLYLFARSACTPPILAGVLGPGCFCARSAYESPDLAVVCGVGVFAWVRVSAEPHQLWLGCWGGSAFVLALLYPTNPGRDVGACLFVCAPLLCPAIPGWDVPCVCVFLGAGLCCAPPCLAGCWGLCACVHAPPAHRYTSLRLVVCGLVVARHLLPCFGSLRFVRASRDCGTRWPLLVGTCLCALVVAGGVPLRRASWLRVVRRASFGPVAFGALVGSPVALLPSPTSRALAPGFTGQLRGARGGRPGIGLFVPAAGPCRGRGAGLARRHTRSGPRNGVVTGGSLRLGLGLSALRLFGVCGPCN